MTRFACSASRSTTLPLPSSPHWAPTTTIPGISLRVYGGAGPNLGAAGRHSQVGTHDRNRVVADLDEARDRARAHLLTEADERVGLAGRIELRQARDCSLERLGRVPQQLGAGAGLAEATDLRDLAPQLVDDGALPRVGRVRGHDHRAGALPALVDDRV